MASIENIPDEILEHVLNYVSLYNDLKACSQVSSRWFTCSKNVYKSKMRLFKHALISGPITYSSFFSHNTVESPSTSFSTARYSHCACVAGNFMYVFGGCNSSCDSITTFNDLWKIDLSNKRKSRVLTTGNYPTPKAHASMVVYNNSLVLFGGWTSPSSVHQQGVLFDELHVYSITENTWCQMYFPFSPPPTAGHSATVHGNIIVVFGGKQKTDISTESCNDIYCLDLDNSEWFKPRVSGDKPEARAGHSQVKVDERHALILSGCSGYNHRHNDIWLLTIPENLRSEHWTWRMVTMNSIQLMPKQLWCYPMSKVDDHIVVLASQNEPEDEGKISKSQFLLQEHRPNGNVWQPPEANNINNGAARNVVGHVHHASPKVQSRAVDTHHANNETLDQHSRPSVRPNACSNREKRLLMLSKYEQHIRNWQSEKDKLDLIKRRQLKPACCMAIYLLDIRKVLTNFEVTWKVGPAWNVLNSPHPRIKSTLLLGKGELILCCGKETGDCTCNPFECIPQLLYINAPNGYS